MTRLPVERIRGKEVNVAQVFAQDATVERERATDNIVSDEIVLMRPALIPLRQRPLKPRVSARAKHTKPSRVNQNTCRMERNGPHRTACRDLSSEQGRFPCRLLCGQDFHADGCFTHPLLHQRPRGVVSVIEFRKRARHV